MTWLRADTDDNAILDEIEKQTDRGAALIAVAYLEDRLLGAILARLTRNSKAESGLFSRSRPLSTFSARIDIGVLVGVYGEALRKILHTIREIRNEFAHQAQPRDFNFQKISALCENIALEAHVEINEPAQNIHIIFHFAHDGTPRSKFMNAIKYLLLVLDMEAKQMPLRVPVPPLFPDTLFLGHPAELEQPAPP